MQSKRISFGITISNFLIVDTQQTHLQSNNLYRREVLSIYDYSDF